MNESKTCAELIDPLLTAAGWGVVDGSCLRREVLITPGCFEGGGRRGKALSSVCIFQFRNTKLVGVEAEAGRLPSEKLWGRPGITDCTNQCITGASETRIPEQGCHPDDSSQPATPQRNRISINTPARDDVEADSNTQVTPYVSGSTTASGGPFCSCHQMMNQASAVPLINLAELWPSHHTTLFSA